mmetsp:Transcript_6267/g.14998  ORF Transcript_6267/g.14998 Transcript_6267/m.14998 type:complete len:327 (+) Transcript_6267:105-1085(+)
MPPTSEGIRNVVKQAQDGGYFQPVCSARHIHLRYYNKEVAQYIGDATHLLALVLCLATILREERATHGVSLKTHKLFFFVYSARFMNIFLCPQPIMLILYKVIVWHVTALIVLVMLFRGARDDRKDTMPVGIAVLPIIVFTIFFGRFSLEDQGLFAEVVWIFSTYLEAVAMLPQYIYCYRDRDNRSKVVFMYVLAMSGYRVVFGASWAFHLITSSSYLDTSSLISGLLGILFFSDFLLFKLAHRSVLSSLFISVDEGFQEAHQAAREAAREAVLAARPRRTKPWQALREAAELAAAQEHETMCKGTRDTGRLELASQLPRTIGSAS